MFIYSSIYWAFQITENMLSLQHHTENRRGLGELEARKEGGALLGRELCFTEQLLRQNKTWSNDAVNVHVSTALKFPISVRVKMSLIPTHA